MNQIRRHGCRRRDWPDAPAGPGDSDGPGRGRSDRRGDLPDSGRDGQDAGLAVLAAGRLAHHGWAAVGGALCFGALAARYPEAGGIYVYLREAYGPRTAFLYGWLSLLVTDPGLTAMLAVGLAGYAGHLVPLSPWGLKAVAVGAIAGPGRRSTCSAFRSARGVLGTWPH